MKHGLCNGLDQGDRGVAFERLTEIGQNSQKGRCTVAAKADHEHCVWGDLLRNQSFPQNAESRIKQNKFLHCLLFMG